MNEIRFLDLLHRFMFYSWLFRDVNRGNLLERRAAWQHNVEASRWLPLYLKRWTVFGAVLFCLGGLVEQAAGAPVVSTFFYVPSAMSVPVCANILAAIACFRFMRVTACPEAVRRDRNGG